MNLLVVDDHGVFRESIARTLTSEYGFTVEICPGIADAIRILTEQRFDVVLLDHDLGDERASQFLPAVRQMNFEGRVLVVTAWISENEARRLIGQGVSGIFLKRGSLADLANAIRTVASGGQFLDPEFDGLGERAVPPESSPRLTDRQRQVLRLVVEGLLNKEIAWRLQISESYVKAILQDLFRITGVRTRGQLVRVAFEQHASELREKN